MLRLLRVPFIPQSHFSDTEASEHAYKWGWFHTFFRQSYEKGNGLPMGGLSERKSMALASEINMCSAAGHSREDIIPSLLILRHRTSSATWETQNCSFFSPPLFIASVLEAEFIWGFNQHLALQRPAWSAIREQWAQKICQMLVK